MTHNFKDALADDNTEESDTLAVHFADHVPCASKAVKSKFAVPGWEVPGV